jgi:NAD+ synthetase
LKIAADRLRTIGFDGFSSYITSFQAGERSVKLFQKSFLGLVLGLAGTLSMVFGGGVFAFQPTKIAMLQFAPVVTDYPGTVEKVIRLYQEAVKAGATLVVTPELVLPGYPPGDLLSDRPEVLERSLAALEQIKDATKNYDIPLVIGHLDRTPGANGRKIQNTYDIFVGGRSVHHYAKHLLPTYNVFDELRHLEPGTEAHVFEWKGTKYGILICEDFWFMDDHDGRLIYTKDPMDQLVAEGAEVLISVSASPYTMGKRQYRHHVHAERAKKAKAPILWVNQTGATDNLVFDGSSFVLDANGELVNVMESFPENDQIGFVDLRGPTKIDIHFEPPTRNLVISGEDPEQEIVLQALLTGLREYVKKTGHSKVVLGLSGGIDSTVTAALAALALGSNNVTGLSMPSKFSSDHSKTDAELLARSLGIRYLVSPIEAIVESLRVSARTLSDALPGTVEERLRHLNGVADENLQARARMVLLYNLANQIPGTLVLTTGCKSELAVGWCTKFGDHAGDFNPVGDLWKTQEIAQGRYINRRQRALGLPVLIPEHILEKRPSPELRPDQFTDQTLPPYEILDRLLEDYLINGLGVQELTAKYGPELLKSQPWRSATWVQEVIARVETAENKRDVAATSTRISRRQFNQKTRRVPVARVGERDAAPISCLDAVESVGQVFERRTARP